MGGSAHVGGAGARHAGCAAGAPTTTRRGRSAQRPPHTRQQQLQIQPRTHRADVHPVVAQLVDGRVAKPAPRLGEARDARAHREPAGKAGVIELDPRSQFRTLRARTHQAHLAPQDVHELRQLIEVEAAQQAAHRGGARIARPCPHGTGGALGVLDHLSTLFPYIPLSNYLLPLVISGFNQSNYIQHHAAQAFNFQLTITIYNIILFAALFSTLLPLENTFIEIFLNPASSAFTLPKTFLFLIVLFNIYCFVSILIAAFRSYSGILLYPYPFNLNFLKPRPY